VKGRRSSWRELEVVPWRELEAAESPIARISHCSWRRRLTAGRRYSCRRRLDIGSVANRRGDERPAGGSGAKLTGHMARRGCFAKQTRGWRAVFCKTHVSPSVAIGWGSCGLDSMFAWLRSSLGLHLIQSLSIYIYLIKKLPTSNH